MEKEGKKGLGMSEDPVRPNACMIGPTLHPICQSVKSLARVSDGSY